MANCPTTHSALRRQPTIRRLREPAAQEAPVTKERLATRTDAARLFFAAVARLAEAKAAWERVLREAQRAQAQAVQDLLGSGLQPDEVAELLGISNGELRSFRWRDACAAASPSPGASSPLVAGLEQSGTERRGW